MTYSFVRGVNLGGWISQYGRANQTHFDHFITATDIDRIAAWGMDHVRLPLDYPVIEDDSRPGVYKESGLKYIDDCLKWCQARELGLILDLHRAPGYSFGSLDSNSLFDSADDQTRYINLWTFLAKRYRGADDGLKLELLNEVVEPNSDRWNALAHRTIAAIRSVDPTRDIIYGGNHYNSVDELNNIDWVAHEDHIIYTFHFYKPHLFTHQNAQWSPMTREYQQTLRYPGRVPGLDEFLDQHPEFRASRSEHLGEMNRDLLERLAAPAADFMARTQKPVYCGEYGVIDHAPLPSRVAWHRDFVDILRHLGIGSAVWTYKNMSFGLVEENGQVVSQELIEIVSQA